MIVSNKRRGYTLIEMVAVAVLSTFILGAAVATTALVTGVSTSTSREIDFYHELARLANSFRSDAHRARAVDATSTEGVVKVPGDGAIIGEMKLADGRSVRYVVGQRLMREVYQDGKLVARDGFEFQRGHRVRMEKREKNGRVFVHLSVVGAPVFDKGDQLAAGRVWEVQAVVGRDLLPVEP